MFTEGAYTPIQVGASVNQKNLGYLRDDSGENISEKNPLYCELTAQYWAWKNLDAEYIGLCHYRRYFSHIFTPENIDAEMKDADMILARRTVWPMSIMGNWCHCLVPEDAILFREYMHRRFPGEREMFEEFFVRNNTFNPCNMFVMRRELFHRFAEWQFSILSDMERLLRPSGYARPRRILGYLAEGLLPYFAHINGLRVKEYPMVSMPGPGGQKLTEGSLARVKNNAMFRLRKGFELADAVTVGLKNDGIIDQIDKLIKGQ